MTAIKSNIKQVVKRMRALKLSERASGAAMAFVARELYDLLNESTPVDTGRAVGNWQISKGSSPDTSLTRTNPSRSAISSEISKLKGIKGNDKVFLTNNVAYIQALENGSSAQAPSGFVRVSLEDLKLVAKNRGIDIEVS